MTGIGGFSLDDGTEEEKSRETRGSEEKERKRRRRARRFQNRRAWKSSRRVVASIIVVGGGGRGWARATGKGSRGVAWGRQRVVRAREARDRRGRGGCLSPVDLHARVAARM